MFASLRVGTLAVLRKQNPTCFQDLLVQGTRPGHLQRGLLPRTQGPVSLALA